MTFNKKLIGIKYLQIVKKDIIWKRRSIMVKVTLGSTGITVNKNGFGALPIQRISHESSTDILRRAYEAGIDFYDTARFYTDSECKLGEALSDVR